MRINPFPDEPTRTQTTEVFPPGARMPDFPLKATPSPPPAKKEPVQENDNAETRQEDARTLRYAIGKLNDFLQWFALVLEVALAIRFVFTLIGANVHNLFAGFLYSLTDIVLYPFIGIVNSGRLEWQTLIAMIIYWLIFWTIRRFLHILITGPEETPT
jgi:hypothetical protein